MDAAAGNVVKEGTVLVKFQLRFFPKCYIIQCDKFRRAAEQDLAPGHRKIELEDSK